MSGCLLMILQYSLAVVAIKQLPVDIDEIVVYAKPGLFLLIKIAQKLCF